MHDKRKTFAASLTTCAVAVATAMIVAPQPAQAGMGTGSPPPPPPPPLIISKRQFEFSADADFGYKGYPGQVIMHEPADINGGGKSCVTTGAGANGGNFTYTVYEGQSPKHRGYLFGCWSAWLPGNQDIMIDTNAYLKFEIPDNSENADFFAFAHPTTGTVKSWKWEYEIERGKTTKVTGSPFVNHADKSIGKVDVPRHASANPNDVQKKEVTFQLKKLEGFDADGILRLKWLDDPVNGRISMFPQDTPTLTINKIKSVVQK